MTGQPPYRPAPLSTDGISLPPALEAKLEMLAEHVHDLWAAKRLREGWVRGDARSDEWQTHPDLVPYPELSDGTRDYDRITARETLRAVIALGWRIVPACLDVVSNKDDPRG